MSIDAASLEWAIDFLLVHGDGDLFPKLPEVEAIKSEAPKFIGNVLSKQLTDTPNGPCRRFLVPKDEFSYRQATQLDPQDSIIFCALMYRFGGQIEARRLPPNVVFSYRFSPSLDDGLYNSKDAWNRFWEEAKRKASIAKKVLYCDIADFYNQIYHHAIENQLIASGLPNQAIKWLIGLMETTTAGVSRGVPVGPHPTHLIAEASLIPIDNALKSHGHDFIRYADDILIFCDSDEGARSALAQVASTLDQQQRLMLQRHKTRVLEPSEFRSLCDEMIEDRPISSIESGILAVIRKHSGGDPYKVITYNSIPAEDWAEFTTERVEGVIREYLAQSPTDFVRLRWFYRRLAQVGHPGAIEISLDNIERLGPCLANICLYLTSIQSLEHDHWLRLGEKLLHVLALPEIENQPYFKLSVLSLFSRVPNVNHLARLTKIFNSADAFAKREIILAAKANAATDWLREYKESFQHMDPWQKHAYIYASSGFPKDEKKFFLGRWEFRRPFEMALSSWAKAQ